MQGIQGPQGEKGSNFIPSVESVETLEPNTPATASARTDGDNLYFSFGIPQGIPGYGTKLSDFENDVGFVTPDTTDLENYIVKDSTYTKTEVDNLVSPKADSSDVTTALATKVNVSDVVDNLESTSSDKVLSAKQGKIVNDKVEEISKIYPYYNSKVHNIFGGTNNGNCQVIENEDHNTIIDFGKEDGISTIMSYLTTNGITKFYHAIVTHYHADHVAGEDGIETLVNSNSFDFSDCIFHLPVIDWASFTGDMSEFQAYESDLVTFLTSKGITIDYVNEDKEIVFDINNKIKITNTTYPSSYYASNSLNNFSLVTELISQGKHFLFTSDIEKLAQEYLYENYSKCDVLTVPHHGVDMLASKHFLERVYPEYAVIMNTTNNYTNREIFDFLVDNNVRTYATNYSGSVVFTISNNEIAVSSTNGEYNVIYENNIMENTDFNDLTRTGKYHVADTTIIASLSNIPLSVQGTLVVEQITTNVIYQKYYCNTTIPVIYTRIYRDNVWSDWRQDNLNNKPILIAKPAANQIMGTSPSVIHFNTYYYERNNTKADNTKKIEILDDYTIKINDTAYSNNMRISGQVNIDRGLVAGDDYLARINKGNTVLSQIKVFASGDSETITFSEIITNVSANDIISVSFRNATSGRGTIGHNYTYLKIELF